jgi:aromatic-L-amino-acid decarboxylase
VSADDPASLDLSAAEMKAMLSSVSERVVEHLASFESQPSRGDLDDAAALCHSLREPPPELGADLDKLLDPLFDDWVHRSFNAPAPGYMAFIPGGGVFPAALGALIGDALNRYTGVWNAAPALVQLEANVLDWFRDWMCYPKQARGLLTSGGSMATFGAVVSARHQRLGTKLREGVLYTSTQAHHSVSKAAHLAGILRDRVRAVDVDERLRMRPDALAAAVADDRSKGLEPFMVVSTAGSTNTGAVDPIDEIANVAEREGLWHHCDAAYGGFFYMCPELRPLMAGLPRADSITLDPHKGLFLPYGQGALLVRDGEALRAAHQADAGYLPPLPDDELYNPCQFGPELSRPYRGLRAWLALKLFGAERFRAALREKRELALIAASQLDELDAVRLLEPPALSLFAFHLDWQGATLEEQNEATLALMQRTTARKRVMLTGSQSGDRFWGRVCVLCFRTRKRHVDWCVEDLRAEAEAIVLERRS